MARIPDIQDMGARPTPQSNRQVATVRNAGAVGEAVAGIGRLGQQAASELTVIDQRRQAAQAGVDYARMTEEITTTIHEARSTAAPGAAGHLEIVRNFTDGRIGQFLESIRDPEVRERFQVNAAQMRARTVGEEDGWEIGQRRELAVSNVTEGGRLMRNQLQTRPDGAALQNFMDVTRSTIDGAGLNADLVETLVRRENAGLSQAYLNGMIERDPAAAREILRSGVLNQWLDPEVARGLVDNADVEVRVREGDARRQQAAARADLMERIQGVDRRFESGEDVPDTELAELQGQASAAGISTEVFDLGRYRVRAQMRREYRNSSPVDVRTALGEVEERIAAAGANATTEDAIRRTELQSILTQRTTVVNNDPLRAYQQAGGRVAPVDTRNPAPIQARDQAARAAQRGGAPYSFYFPEEITRLQSSVATGASGRLQAINEVAAIAAVNPQGANQMAERVAPGDRTFRHALRLAPAMRSYVVRGADARRTMPQNTQREDGSRATYDDRAREFFSAYIAPALRQLPPDFAEDVLQTALNIDAEIHREHGTDRSRFDQAEVGRAVNYALGRSSQGGGMGYWRPGPQTPTGGPYGVLLPVRMTEGQFERVMTYLPIARLGERFPSGSANGTPVYSDGTGISTDDLRGRFVPTPVSDGVYQFRNGNNVVMTREGRPFELNVYRLAASPPARAHQRPAAPAATNSAPTPPRMRSAYEAQPARDVSNASPNPTMSRAQWEAIHGPLPPNWRPGQPLRGRRR